MSSIVSSSRLPGVQRSIFADVSLAAKRCGALNLSQGFPDFAPDRRLLEALKQAVSGNYHQYGIPEGSEVLRQSISRMYGDLYQIEPDPEAEITITAGATQAIFAAISSLIHAGEEVIFFSPAFESYAPAVLLAGAVPICINLNAPKFDIEWEEVEQRVTTHTRMIIVNSPHNPSGRCWTAHDVTRLAEISYRHNLLVLSDEVYHNMVFDGPHITAISDDRLRNRTVVIGSLGKMMHVTGWRIGYAISAAPLTNEVRKVLQFNTYAAPTLLQQAMAAVLDEAAYRDLPELFRRKRNRFIEGLENSRFTFTPTSGGYFQLVDYSAISDLADAEFAAQLMEIQGVAALPVSGFGSQYARKKLLRFCFAKQEQTLDAATAILRHV